MKWLDCSDEEQRGEEGATGERGERCKVRKERVSGRVEMWSEESEEQGEEEERRRRGEKRVEERGERREEKRRVEEERERQVREAKALEEQREQEREVEAQGDQEREVKAQVGHEEERERNALEKMCVQCLRLTRATLRTDTRHGGETHGGSVSTMDPKCAAPEDGAKPGEQAEEVRDGNCTGEIRGRDGRRERQNWEGRNLVLHVSTAQHFPTAATAAGTAAAGAAAAARTLQ